MAWFQREKPGARATEVTQMTQLSGGLRRREQASGPQNAARRLSLLRLVLLLLVLSSGLQAQATTSSNQWPQRGWVFLSVGLGSIENSLAGAFGGSYSPGPLIFTLRGSGAAEFSGDGIQEGAFLIGARSSGARDFVSAQLGPSAIHRYHSCDCSGNNWTGPIHGGLAFDVAVQGNWGIPGIGFDFFGDLLPSTHRYAALAVMLQLGWFGE